MPEAPTKPKRKSPRRAPPIALRVDVPGARAATLKLVEIGPDSYTLFRSARRIGTARVEEDASWSARFAAPDGEWTAPADSAEALLTVVGRYLLTGEARDAAARPLEETTPELKAKGRKTPEQLLSLKLLRQAQARRLATLDAALAGMRRALRKR